jgi:hypothetical protein
MTGTNMNTSASITFLAIIAMLIFIGPVFTIMALNKVFGMGLVLDFYTWLSVFWLQGLLVTKVNSNK